MTDFQIKPYNPQNDNMIKTVVTKLLLSVSNSDIFKMQTMSGCSTRLS